MKLKLNILDWILIGILLLATLFVLYRTLWIGQPIFIEQNRVVLEYQMEFRRKTPEFRDAIMVGDVVYVSARERDEAEVIEVISRPAQVITLDREANEYIITEIPRHYDVIVTLRSEVVETDREFRNGGTPIRVGAECVMRGRGYAAEGFIINMRRYGEEWFDIVIAEYDPYEIHENGGEENGEGGGEE